MFLLLQDLLLSETLPVHGHIRTMPFEFSEKEIAEVKRKFSKLDLVRPYTWKGVLNLYAEFNGYPIRDSYEIEITASGEYPAQVPFMREVGGRTRAIAQKYKLNDLRSLHYNLSNGTACLCVKQMEKGRFPPGSNLVTFIDDLVIPYLYGLSYYDKNGRWPWIEYNHGSLGLLEFYAEDESEQTKESIQQVVAQVRLEINWKEYHKQFRKPSPEKLCVCGSRKPFQKCHPRAWPGVLRLHADLKRFQLNLDNLDRLCRAAL